MRNRSFRFHPRTQLCSTCIHLSPSELNSVETPAHGKGDNHCQPKHVADRESEHSSPLIARRTQMQYDG
jgi:hypothetical protein